MDLCLTCGKELEDDLWGAKCKEGHITVHLRKCDFCEAEMGYINSDDYDGISRLACPECMKKARAKCL